MELEDLFSDILYTTENPVVINTERVFKEGDKIKRVSEKKIYDLTSNDILSELRKCDKQEVIFYQKGILRLFRKCDKSEIVKILKESSSSDYKFIAMNEKTRGKLFCADLTFHNLHLYDELSDDEIIIGDKVCNCIINKETGEYYFDKSSIVILCLT